MSFIECMNDTWINTTFIKRLVIEQNEDALEENGSDAYGVYAITTCMHQDISEIVFLGTEAECRYLIMEILENASRTKTVQ